MHHDDEKAGKSKKRRELGAHYTSEENILKVIQPLFLDELWEEFNKIKNNRKVLGQFHDKLSRLQFLDPACGCGNFLVVTYRELRLLELEVIRVLHSSASGQSGDVSLLARLDVHQFHGIEIDSTAARIAVVAMWLTDHQMNMRLQQLGTYYHRLPLKQRANIVCANALEIDWNSVIPEKELNYLLGNPPFIGKHYRTPQQKAELISSFENLKSAGDLDFVAAWYAKATNYVKQETRCAFVSTNSITQGEQAPILWPEFFRRGFHIHFAHRTFQWSNEGRGIAAVHCIIIGFAKSKPKQCLLFDYENPKSEAKLQLVASISPYLTPGSEQVIKKRQEPLNPQAPIMRCGNKPTDGGYLILTPNERAELLKENPNSEKFIRRYIGADEFINGTERYCLWLEDATPAELRSFPGIIRRIESVKKFRASSTAQPTRKAAATPTRFFFTSQPKKSYILVPEVSSERRIFIPIGFMSADVITSNKNYIIPSDSLYLFGILQSTMHMAWMRTVAGRLESRYQYSGTMVYNTFPWPRDTNEKHLIAIESAAQAVLDARNLFPDSTLADLYGLLMPAALVKAHQKLDKAVDAAYLAAEKAAGNTPPKLTSDAERVAFLFELYQRYTSLLPATPAKAAKKKRDG